MIINKNYRKIFVAAITTMRKFYTFFWSLFLSSIVTAQPEDQDTITAKELSEVIITGQYRPQSAKNSVYQVRTISKERILRQGAAQLQDVLNTELNIRFAQDLATGGAGITMMGLKGQNVKILLDGLPITGRQGTSNEININQLDINAIERIEIVEGPMSVVYGADALAGVINIITKKAGAAKFSVTAKLHEESIGNEYGFKLGIHNQYAGLTAQHKNWEIGAAFGRNYFGGWKDTASDRELVWHKKDQLIANGFIGFSKSNPNGNRFTIHYRIDGLDEIITNPGNFLFRQQSSGDTLAYDQDYLSQRLMHQLRSSIFVNNRLNGQLQSAYTNYSRQVFSTTVSKQSGDIRLDMGTGRQSVVNFTGFTFRSTVFYKVSSMVSFQPGLDINLDRGEGERLKAGNNAVNDHAFFITAEITPSSKVNIRPGFRVIKNSVYKAPPLVPSLNAKFSLSKNIDLRLAYARGFRSPSLRELYYNFFDANHQLIGNPDLEAETSHSLNGSLTWRKISPKEVVYTTLLSGFYNNVNDLIDYAISSNNPGVFILTNVSNSKTAGVTMGTTASSKKWTIAAGMGLTGFYNDFAATDPQLPQLQWSPEANFNLGYRLSPMGMDINLFYKFTGKRPFYIINSSQEIILARQHAYHMADITVNKKAFNYFSFTAGIRNLLDVDRVTSTTATGGVHSSGGIANIASGRSVFAGLVFNWEKK